MSGYDPSRSQNSPEKLSAFIQAPITGDLSEVPGIGPATIKLLAENGVSTTFGLIGKFMMLKEKDVQPVEHCDRFFYWLESIKAPAGFRSSIVEAIAQKTDINFQGIYDSSCYE